MGQSRHAHARPRPCSLRQARSRRSDRRRQRANPLFHIRRALPGLAARHRTLLLESARRKPAPPGELSIRFQKPRLDLSEAGDGGTETRYADGHAGPEGRSLLARTNKLKGNKAPQEPVEKLLETIIEDVSKAAAMSVEDWWALSQFPLTPLAIPVEPGREYRVTQGGVDAAHSLTEQTWWKREDFRQTISRAEFNKLSFTAIGETILNCRTHLPSDTKDHEAASLGPAFYAALAGDCAVNLGRLADRARPDVDRHIPCHLFNSNQGVAPSWSAPSNSCHVPIG